MRERSGYDYTGSEVTRVQNLNSAHLYKSAATATNTTNVNKNDKQCNEFA